MESRTKYRQVYILSAFSTVSSTSATGTSDMLNGRGEIIFFWRGMNYLWRDINYHVILRQGWGGGIGDCEINIVAKRINPPDQQQIIIKHAYEKMLFKTFSFGTQIRTFTNRNDFFFFFFLFRFIPVSFRFIPVHSGVIPVHSGPFRCHSGSFRSIPPHSSSFRSVSVFSNAHFDLHFHNPFFQPPPPPVPKQTLRNTVAEIIISSQNTPVRSSLWVVLS